MLLFPSCNQAISACRQRQSFSVAHLYNDDATMKIHIHDVYEIYYAISGGRQFLVDDRIYDFKPGDIFFINQYESHYVTQVDCTTHERIVLFIDPEFLVSCSTEQTDLNYCFKAHKMPGSHKICLTADEQAKFLYYVHRFQDNTGYGADILDRTTFMDLMLFLNIAFRRHSETGEMTTIPAKTGSHHAQVDEILSYINTNVREELSIDVLAGHFYMSSSNICKIFKEETGTTLNRYITAKRITIAKELLSQGSSVTDACLECGFKDYSSFLKAFTKAVGVSPKKYAVLSH